MLCFAGILERCAELAGEEVGDDEDGEDGDDDDGNLQRAPLAQPAGRERAIDVAIGVGGTEHTTTKVLFCLDISLRRRAPSLAFREGRSIVPDVCPRWDLAASNLQSSDSIPRSCSLQRRQRIVSGTRVPVCHDLQMAIVQASSAGGTRTEQRVPSPNVQNKGCEAAIAIGASREEASMS